MSGIDGPDPPGKQIKLSPCSVSSSGEISLDSSLVDDVEVDTVTYSVAEVLVLRITGVRSKQEFRDEGRKWLSKRAVADALLPFEDDDACDPPVPLGRIGLEYPRAGVHGELRGFLDVNGDPGGNNGIGFLASFSTKRPQRLDKDSGS
jgi:hypothetical protein